MKRAYTDIPEGQMHYRIEGDGEPLLLLHASVSSSDEFTRAMHFLSNSYRAIAPDFLGHGESDPAPYEYLYADHCRSIASFMDSLGIEKACIVGHHAGGGVAGELAITAPERVRKLVMSGVAIWEPRGGAPLVDPPNFSNPVEIQADGSHLLEWWRRATMWGDKPVEIAEEEVLEYMKAGPRGEEIHWAGRAYDARPRLPLIACPTLVLSATYDPFYSVAEEVRSLLPDGKLAIIKDGLIDVDRLMPQEFAEAILDFLGAPEG